ncbi:MAG: flavoprotein [Candidatus Omnitrophota bacterium]|jgi:phosphopantothenoylcysteine decarboxylase/phosphopantothenate--cysteine ligase
MTKASGSVILGVTGSIAAYKACDLVSLLKKDGFDVTVLLTKEALEFVTPLTFETLSGNKVITDMFELPASRSPIHTSLADRADIIVVAPATANLIGKLACGICDDILSCTIFATDAPVLIAPAMNDKMYKHKIVQANIEKLKGTGYHFIGPIKGHLACGHEDIGHIAGSADIIQEVMRLVK